MTPERSKLYHCSQQIAQALVETTSNERERRALYRSLEWLGVAEIRAMNVEASTKDLSRPGADLLPDLPNDLEIKSIMADQPELTAKQQKLMDFLNELATAPVTPELVARGNQLLDAAADECRQQQEAIRQQQASQNQEID